MKHEQIADYLNHNISQALEAQNLRFREHWEPQVTAALTPAAGECLAKIKQALARQRRMSWHRRNPAALRLALGAGCAPIAARHCVAAGEVLIAMVQAESGLAGEALSLGGLLGQAISPAQRHPDPQGEARRLAAVAALERVVEKSYRLFVQRVGAELEQAATGEPDWVRLEASMERLAGTWGSRLATIARTLTHAAATRLRLALA
ncbi:MAG: hypothetical protein KJ720_07075 [Proteobacteria bacterium]|nr:hypothetical protein [Pseudomonadota bacterium]MBU1452053.1 hypothetical protein [Pseudomonadota bacterium]MBU2468036.1 hypothetical protein [Pseudomonadota bacterium]MBU2519165.1 hypothetical protein [Pseudomonadota bacterium]